MTNIFNGDGVEPSKEERERDTTLGAATSSNSLDRKLSTSSFDQLRRKATDMGTLTRRGSLERKTEKRRSWSPDDFANSIENFRPITITVSSFFKQVHSTNPLFVALNLILIHFHSYRIGIGKNERR